MKTDILLIPMSARWADMRAAALAVEEAGFDGLWTWDHLRDPEAEADSDAGVPEAMTVLAALAEATRRIALGPLVLNVSNRHPGLLAQMAATLQQISGGRLLVGLGAGGHRNLPYAAEQQMLGLDVESDAVRAQRVAEAADVMRRLWRGDGTSLQGAHYRLERPSGYLRVDPAPPIVVGDSVRAWRRSRAAMPTASIRRRAIRTSRGSCGSRGTSIGRAGAIPRASSPPSSPGSSRAGSARARLIARRSRAWASTGSSCSCRRPSIPPRSARRAACSPARPPDRTRGVSCTLSVRSRRQLG